MRKRMIIITSFFRHLPRPTYRIRENFHHGRLGLFHNLSNIRRIAIGLSLLRIGIHTEGLFAASLATRISLSTAIDADATTTRRRMQEVQVLFLAIFNGKGWHTEPAIFFDGSHGLSSRRNGRFLVAAALATTRGTAEWTFDCQELGFRVDFLDRHSVPVRTHKRMNTYKHAMP